MGQVPPPEYRRRRPGNSSSPWPWILLAVVATPLLIIVITAVVVLGGISQAWQAAGQVLAGGRTVVAAEGPGVIVQVQNLQRLETASYTVEKVITGGVDRGHPLANVLAGDRLLFIAHGQVFVGVDLGRLQPEDVSESADRQTVTVRLPAAQVLTHRLDNEKSRVYDRQTGLLARADVELETKVRQEAESQILSAACEGGILAQANANAQAQVRALLLNLGYREVQFRPSAAVQPTGCE